MRVVIPRIAKGRQRQHCRECGCVFDHLKSEIRKRKSGEDGLGRGPVYEHSIKCPECGVKICLGSELIYTDKSLGKRWLG